MPVYPANRISSYADGKPKNNWVIRWNHGGTITTKHILFDPLMLVRFVEESLTTHDFGIPSLTAWSTLIKNNRAALKITY